MSSPFTLLASVLLRRGLHGLRDGLSISLLRSLTVLCGSFGLLIGVYWGSRAGLQILFEVPGLGEILCARLPGLVYLLLSIMLTISSAVTFLGIYFRSRETSFLYALPVPRRTVFLQRWVESTFYSTWAFPIMIIPFHVALSQTLQANRAYMISFPLFLIPFSVLASSVGAIAGCGVTAIGLTRGLLKRVLLVVLVVSVFYCLRGGQTAGFQLLDDNPIRFLQTTLVKFSLGFSPSFPAGWWFLGAEALRVGDLERAFGFWCLMSTTALMVLWIALWLSPGPVFRLWARGSTSKSSSSGIRSEGLSIDRLLGFLPPQTKALFAKDLRLLLRDPGQWAQSALLYGLMGVYVMSLRGMAYQNLPVKWRLVVTTANFAAVAGIVASLGTRFFFPLPSLEGKMAWLVRLAPLAPARALTMKLILGMLWTYPPTVALSVATILMLDLPQTLVITAVTDVLFMNAALMSLSVGLGAILPEFGQEEASKIVSGFGGTVTLLLSLAYVILATAIISVQLGLIPLGSLGASHVTGTVCLALFSTGISFSVMKIAIKKVRTLEISA